MKLLALLGLTLPAIQAQSQLTYPGDIDLFEFYWTNPDQNDDTMTGPADGTLMTDGNIAFGTGETLAPSAGGVGMWGSSTVANTVGMVGTFEATTLNVGTGYSYWSISQAQVVFDGGCFMDGDTSVATASAYYFDRSTGSKQDLTATITYTDELIFTFSADIATAIETNGYIGFEIQTNAGCEGFIEMLEFVVVGEQVATEEPTMVPTSDAPTTVAPSSAPTETETTTTTTTTQPTTSTTEPPTTAPPTTAPPTTSTVEECEEMDFHLSIQLSSGSCSRSRQVTVNYAGEERYTGDLSEGGDWSEWAGNSKYSTPDAFRIGIHSEEDWSSEFCLKDTDIRFCIQLTDGASDSSGNWKYNGAIECTPWASESGGWSEFAGDSDDRDFEAVRVSIETRELIGLQITDVMTGAWLSDNGCKNIAKAGDPVYTNWISWNTDDNWSVWGSDNDWNKPDAVAIFLGVNTNQGVTQNSAAAFEAAYEYADEDSGGLSGGAVAAIVCAVLIVLAAMAGFVWYRRKNKVLRLGVDDEDIGTLGDHTVTAGVQQGGYDMNPVGAGTGNGDMEQEVMVEVNISETNH